MLSHQCGRCCRLAAEHGQRQPRAHIADIAVSAGKPRNRRLAQRQFADQLADDHGDRKGEHGAERGRDQEWRIVEFGERRSRHDPEQQRRQRHVEQEEVHPGEPGLRQRLGSPAGVADEDQAEIGYRQIDYIDHAEMNFLECFLTRGDESC
jgi:hypothetical protein